MRSLKIWLCLLLLLGVAAGYAQKVGTSSFQFLKVMPGARATALGDAYVTMAAGADALFWNPAGLVLATDHHIATTYTLWLFDSRQTALGSALPLGDFGTLGLQLQYVDYGEIEETNVENLKFVDLTTSFTWDRVARPVPREDGTVPNQDDLRTTFGVMVDF